MFAFSRHSSSKYKRNSVCKDCDAAQARAYYGANKETVAVKARAYREKNADTLRQKKADYFQANKAAIVSKRREEREADPDRFHAYWAAYYAKRKDDPDYIADRRARASTSQARASKLAANRAYRYAYSAQVSAYQRKYRKKNAETIKERNARRYAESLTDSGSRLSVVRAARRRHIGQDGFISWSEFRRYCAEAKRLSDETGVPHVVDHIYPLVSDRVSGLNTPANLRVVPRKVNTEKFNKLLASLSHEHFATEPWEVYQDV
jgi:hypothetical protein